MRNYDKGTIKYTGEKMPKMSQKHYKLHFMNLI